MSKRVTRRVSSGLKTERILKTLGMICCRTCGGPTKKLADGRYECVYCGNVFEYIEKEDDKDDRLDGLLLNANNFMVLGKFDDAADTYRIIIKNYPREKRAYWGAFLAEYGIEYIEDGGKKQPICHRISRLSALESSDLKALFACCDPAEREEYYSLAERIERVRLDSYEISKLQEPYEIFVCCGDLASESDKANALYDALVAKGRKVFMPQKNVRADAKNAEAYVYPAIENARYMFVIAASIETLSKTDSTWRRFIADKSKKIQVLHGGLDEQSFPADLRRTVQRLEPILLSDPEWLVRAVEFATEKKAEPIAAPQVDKAYIDDLMSRLEHSDGMYGRRADNATEAFVMTLSCLAAGNAYEGERAINEQLDRFRPSVELRAVAELCLELTKLPRLNEYERRNCMASISNIAGRIKAACPTLSAAERALYPEISNAKLLVYLAKCFGAIKDYGRQCFVLDMIDYDRLYDTRIINELISMQFKVGRYDDVKNVLRKVPQMDGDYVLMALLKNFGGEQKQTLLLDIADRMRCTDAVESEINYWLATCDNADVALTVASIMTRNKIPLSSMALNGALSKVRDVSGVRAILENIGARPLMGAEVDRLVAIGADGGDVAANEVLSYLYNVAHVTDIGTHNMYLLMDKCRLSAIKTNLFRFNMDKNLATQLLAQSLKSASPDRLSNVRTLVEYVPSVDISAYERLLLSTDPSKKALLETLAPHTGKFASYSNAIERYLASDCDDDETKREIYALYGDFPFSDRARELYLDILPETYDDKYIEQLKLYLESNPARSRDIFTKHYEALSVGYEKALPLIASYIRYMPDDGIVRFVCDFRGEQRVKNELFRKLSEFSDKPKAIEVKMRDVTCNLAQAYLITMTEPDRDVADIIDRLRKRGVKCDEKVIYYGKKLKFKDYLQQSELSPKTVAEISKII